MNNPKRFFFSQSNFASVCWSTNLLNACTIWPRVVDFFLTKWSKNGPGDVVWYRIGEQIFPQELSQTTYKRSGSISNNRTPKPWHEKVSEIGEIGIVHCPLLQSCRWPIHFLGNHQYKKAASSVQIIPHLICYRPMFMLFSPCQNVLLSFVYSDMVWT